MSNLFRHNDCRYYYEQNTLLPSVTTILGKTSNKYFIEKWRKSMSIEDYDAYMNYAISRGDALHKALEQYSIDGTEPDCPIFAKIKPVLDQIEIIHSELFLTNNELGYAGTADVIGKKDGGMFIGDYKTSTKHKTKSKLNDYPLQLSAYWAILEKQVGKIDNGYIWVVSDVKPTAYECHFSREELISNFDKFKVRLDYFYELYPDLTPTSLIYA
ncbi:MAG: hypothetical protein ACRDBG_20755 [Waterburya sp.]